MAALKLLSATFYSAKQKISLWSAFNSLQSLQVAQNKGLRTEVFMTCIPVLSVLAHLQTSAKTIRPSLINGRVRVLKTGSLIDFGSIWMKHKLGGCAEHLNQLWKQTHLSDLINLTQFGSLWIQRLPGGLGPVPRTGWMLQRGSTHLQHFTQCNWVRWSTRVHWPGGCY